MSDREQYERRSGPKGLFGGKVKDMIFSEDDYDPKDIQPMQNKKHFDDDRSDVPTVKSAISEIDGKLRIFVGKGDRVVVKIDKEMPDVEIAARNISLAPNSRALVVNSGMGALGVVLAALNRDTNIFLHDSNVQNSKLSRRNLEANFEFTKRANVLEGAVPEKSMDSVIYDISAGYTALETVNDNVLLAGNALKIGGKFYCVTFTRAGAPRHEAIIRNVFGDENVVTIAKGNGGFRIIEATNRGANPEKSFEKTRDTVDFSILGRSFSLYTEAGLFSKEGLDAGTRLLLESVPLTSFSKLLDLGCGWGPIGIVAATTNTRGSVVMVDVDTRAVATARKNVDKMGLGNRIKVIATDNVRTIGGNFDLILSNPPFHADMGKLIEMFKGVKKATSKNGKIFMVVEKSYLGKFESILGEVFSHHYIVNQDSNYYILGI